LPLPLQVMVLVLPTYKMTHYGQVLEQSILEQFQTM